MPDQKTAAAERANAAQAAGPAKTSARRWLKPAVAVVAVAAVLAAMFLNTKFIANENLEQYTGKQFSAEEFAAANFEPVVLPGILEKAQPAAELYAAIKEDLDAAGEAFGGRDGSSAWAFPVSFTGVAGDVNTVNGRMEVQIAGIPADLKVLVQMGPPVIGSALRDVTGTISFGMFLNQTEFQHAGQALNDVVRANLLQDFKAAELKGKTISVVGAFQGDQATSRWLVTPVQITVEG
ncbi:MAG: DUF2291 domain-containing protein [Propionibacteriaceae bacterium]|jgi:predicted lipoprotein|nr:DUF2291 domain-containing protein [Propionibacteriaceae bacterium]